jgi:preprotein translocase subunit SecF
VLMIGLVAGTYSSMFIACQLLVTWDKGEGEQPPAVRERRPQEGVV